MNRRQTPAKINPNQGLRLAPSLENANPVHVYCRIKPLADSDTTCMRVELPNTVVLSPPENAVNYKLGHLKETKYSFTHVFNGGAEQEEVYEIAAKPLVEALIKGENGLLFTYGVTGSGKTYTMTGNLKSRGIMSRCLDFLFDSIKGSQSRKYVFKSDKMNGFEVLEESDSDIVSELENYFEKFNSKTNGKRSIYGVFVNYVEVYNNSVFDLLENSTIHNRNTLQSRIIREDAHHNMYVHGVTELEVQNVDEAIQAFNVGQKRKRIGHTILNANSSRSHSIFTIRLVQTCIDTVKNSCGPINISQLSLVDLAGSERLSRTKNTGQRLKEAGNINNSLMTLRTCLELLRENQMTGSLKKIPYRDSKLTNLFKNYFEGNGIVKMIVCVSPKAEDYDETAQVMKFAEMTQDIQIIKTPAPPTPSARYTVDKFDFKPSISYFNFGTFPQIVLNTPSQRFMINELVGNLENRITKRRELSQNVNEVMSIFRSRLTEINNQNINFKSEVKVAKLNSKKHTETIHNLEKKILHLERCLKDVQSYAKEVDTENYKLKRDLDDQQEVFTKTTAKEKENKQLLYEDLHKKKEELKLKYQQKLEAEIQAIKDKFKNDSKKLEALANILNAHEINIEGLEEIFDKNEYSQHIPLSNPRYRRSKSADRWVEHRTNPVVPLGTIFQPFFKARKSITRVDESDLVNNKNYCLVDQVAKKSGEIETKLFKGDIIPTSAGGAQVIFNDVECLTQKSPTSSDRKRICSVSIQEVGSSGTPAVTIKRTKI